MFYIINLKRSLECERKVYWKSGAFGYTDNIEEAGIYSYSDMLKYCSEDVEGYTVSIPVK